MSFKGVSNQYSPRQPKKKQGDTPDISPETFAERLTNKCSEKTMRSFLAQYPSPKDKATALATVLAKASEIPQRRIKRLIRIVKETPSAVDHLVKLNTTKQHPNVSAFIENLLQKEPISTNWPQHPPLLSQSPMVSSSRTDSLSPKRKVKKPLDRTMFDPLTVQEKQLVDGMGQRTVTTIGNITFATEEKRIGKGGAGIVHKAFPVTKNQDTWTPSKQPVYAIKTIRSRQKPKKVVPMLGNEVALHKSVSEHPNIATLYSASLSEGNMLTARLVMDFHPSNMKQEMGTATPKTKQKWIKQLLETIEFLHQKGITHFDIKPENILIDENGDIQLTDFGISQHNPTSVKGASPFYRDPEMVKQGSKLSPDLLPKYDLWSAAITILEITGTDINFYGNAFKMTTAMLELSRNDYLDQTITKVVGQNTGTWWADIVTELTKPMAARNSAGEIAKLIE